jgi:hypothetical protein
LETTTTKKKRENLKLRAKINNIKNQSRTEECRQQQPCRHQLCQDDFLHSQQNPNKAQYATHDMYQQQQQ